MSRSYKRQPYCMWVVMSPREVKRIKRLANRQYRHKMNRGLFDDYSRSLSLHKRVEDYAWTHDLGKQYLHKDRFTEETYRKLLKK